MTNAVHEAMRRHRAVCAGLVQFSSGQDKDAVIAVLIEPGVDGDDREVLYRAWCRARKCSPFRSELERLRAGRTTDMIRPLF